MYHLFLLLDLFGVHFFSRQLVHTQVPFGTEYQIQVETVPIAAYSQYNAIHQVVCVFTSRCQNHSKACNFLYDGQLPVQMSGKPCFHWGSYLFFLFSVSSPLERGSLKLLLFLERYQVPETAENYFMKCSYIAWPCVLDASLSHGYLVYRALRHYWYLPMEVYMYGIYWKNVWFGHSDIGHLYWSHSTHMPFTCTLLPTLTKTDISCLKLLYGELNFKTSHSVILAVKIKINF